MPNLAIAAGIFFIAFALVATLACVWAQEEWWVAFGISTVLAVAITILISAHQELSRDILGKFALVGVIPIFWMLIFSVVFFALQNLPLGLACLEATFLYATLVSKLAAYAIDPKKHPHTRSFFMHVSDAAALFAAASGLALLVMVSAFGWLKLRQLRHDTK